MDTIKREYMVKRVETFVPLVGELDGTPWVCAESLVIGLYPWYEKGERQRTAVRALYDDEALYLQFRCEDRHIYSRATELNGDVWLDSCAEFFAVPCPGEGLDYFNVEMNCCGVFLVEYGPKRTERRRITAQQAAGLTIMASESGPTREERPGEDCRWWIAARLPFRTLSEFTGKDVRAGSGVEWLANFYRCGGKTDPQYAVWNPVETPEPDYHQPDYFGRLYFE